jgi:hypothetical protein
MVGPFLRLPVFRFRGGIPLKCFPIQFEIRISPDLEKHHLFNPIAACLKNID